MWIENEKGLLINLTEIASLGVCWTDKGHVVAAYTRDSDISKYQITHPFEDKFEVALALSVIRDEMVSKKTEIITYSNLMSAFEYRLEKIAKIEDAFTKKVNTIFYYGVTQKPNIFHEGVIEKFVKDEVRGEVFVEIDGVKVTDILKYQIGIKK